MNKVELLISRYPQLTPCRKSIEDAIKILFDSYSKNGKLLICGNGGSAADADHIAGELLKGFCSKRILSDATKNILGESIAEKLQDALPAISLHSLGAINTAWLNDCDPEYVYAQLVWGFSKNNSQDILWGISTSGNSKNVFHAFEVAQKCGLKTILLTGESGGKIKNLATVSICVPEKETYKIQELHLPIYHTICLALEEMFFS